jgi:hypothetical protein
VGGGEWRDGNGGVGASVVTSRSLSPSYNNQLDGDREKEGGGERRGDDSGIEQDKGAIASKRGRRRWGGS